jgi:hypothetical protein
MSFNTLEKISGQTTQLWQGKKVSEEELLQTMISIHQRHDDQAMKGILNSLSADARHDLFAKGAELFDDSGSNLALEWAKGLENADLRKEAIESVERKLNEKSNQEFSQNLQKQLSIIRCQLQQAIQELAKDSAGENPDWWENQLPVEKAAVQAELEAIQEKIKDKEHLRVAYAGSKNRCLSALCQTLEQSKSVTMDQAAEGSADLILAPHTLYSEMESIFKASEDLLEKRSTVKDHPLFKYFSMLNKDGIFVATLNSGPNIKDFTHLILGKHESQFNLLNNVETFFRCLDIFARFFEEETGMTIDCQLSYSMPRLPLDKFCASYIKQFPELAAMTPENREIFIRLLSVFNLGGELIDLNMTLQMSVKEKEGKELSFKPLFMDKVDLESTKTQSASNDIVMGQQNLERQLQSLNGSEISMPYIKDADGKAQFKALRSALGCKELNLVEIGGGRGETNAVLKAIKDSGSTLHVLNFDPDARYLKPYNQAHQAVGIEDVTVVLQGGELVSSHDVTTHFKGEKADVVFASHSFYFFLASLHKASQSSMPLAQHPLYKYFDMMKEDGTLVLTMQTGAGARLIGKALLGEHGLTPPASCPMDEAVPLLASFGNIGAHLRYVEGFSQRYKKETGKNIQIKMHHSVANVPLGNFKIEQDPETGGYSIHNPEGEDSDPHWVAPVMLEFYGNWKELEVLSHLTMEKVGKMKPDEQKKRGLENCTLKTLCEKRKEAQKKQEIFLQILHFFAPACKNMQHPNITLEITIEKPYQ